MGLTQRLAKGQADRSNPVAAMTPSLKTSGKQHVCLSRCQSTEYQPFPTTELPPVVRRFVEGVSDSLSCDVAYVTFPLMASLSAALGTSVKIQIKSGWQEYAALWLVTVGHSGAGKSPSFKRAIAPYRLLENERQEAFRQRQENRVAVDGILSDGEPVEESEPEQMPRLMVSADVTLEGLLLILLRESALLLADDEIDGLFKGLNQYRSGKGNDRSKILKLHDGEKLTSDRKTGPVEERSIVVEQGLLSITGGVQPGVLRSAFSGDDLASGFGARFCFAMPPDKPLRWSDAPMPDGLEVESLLRFLLEKREAEEIVHLTSEARGLIREFYDGNASSIEGMTGPVRSFRAKSAARVARLALVLHCCDGGVGEVSEKTMRSAIKIGNWLDEETCRIYDTVLLTNADDPMQELLDFVLDRDGVTVRETMRWKQSRYRTSEQAENALMQLVREGHLYQEVVRAGRTQKVVFQPVTDSQTA